LTLSSIYLAAIVGTDLDQKKKDYEQLEDNMTAQVSSLKTEVAELNNQLEILKIQKTTLDERIQGWVATNDTLTQTNKEQGLLLTNTLEELKQAKAEIIKQDQQLDDLTKELMEKVAVIGTLDKEKRLLHRQRAGACSAGHPPAGPSTGLRT
jgi:DNA repair exonuclease SbcCD ATPase subunit